MDTSKLEDMRALASEIAIEARLKKRGEQNIETIENLKYIEAVAERIRMHVQQCLYTLRRK